MNCVDLIKRTLTAVGCVIALFLCILFWVVFTPSGTSAAWRTVSSLIDGLSAEHVSGSLDKGLIVRGLDYQSDSLSIQLGTGQFRWLLRGRMFGELYVSKLALSDLSITTRDSSGDSSNAIGDKLPDQLPLPLRLVFADVELKSAQLLDADGSLLMQLEHATLKGEVNRDKVLVELIDIHGPDFTLSGDVTCIVAQHYETRSALEWSSTIPRYGSMTGTLDIEGNISGIDYKLLAQRLHDKQGEFSLTATGEVALSKLVLDKLLLSHAQSSAVLEASGWLEFDHSNPYGELDIQWSNLGWPLVIGSAPVGSAGASRGAAEWVHSPAGQLSVEGTFNRYRIVTEAYVATSGTPNGSIDVSATGTSTSMDFDKIALDAFKGKALGSAKFDWANDFQASFNITGKGFDPGEVLAEWGGEIDFSIRGVKEGRNLNIEQITASGSLRDKPLRIDASISHDGLVTNFSRFEFTSGESLVDVQGTLGKKVDLIWRLRSPDLADFLPKARGEIVSRGTLSGRLPWPSIETKLSVSNASFASYGIGSIQLEASIDPLSQATSSLLLDANQISVGNHTISALHLSAGGTRGAHSGMLNLRSDMLQFSTRVSGGWSDSVWQGTLSSGNLQLNTLDDWQLVDPQTLRVTSQSQHMDTACWRGRSGRLCFEVERLGGVLKGSLNVYELPLGYLEPLLASTVRVDGAFSGSADFSYDDASHWSASGRANSSASTISLANYDGHDGTSLTGIEPGELSFKGTSEGISATLALPLTGGGGLDAKLNVASISHGFDRAELVGDASLDLRDIAFVSAFSQELGDVSGKLKLDLNLVGTPQDLRPTGQFHLSKAQFELKTPGLTLFNIDLLATGDGSGLVNYDGRAASGDGVFEVAGSSHFGDTTRPSKLHIKGSNFTIWNTADAKLVASPDLQLLFSDTLIDITGNVYLPEANITPQELPSGAISVSPDQIIVTPDASALANKATELPDIRSRLRLELGEMVEMEGFGFKGRMEGAISLEQNPGDRLLASGELNIVDGEYRAYGQGLVVDRGQIVFTGSAIDNPGISIRALRRPAPNVVVGVNATGELRQPEVTVFSQPAMTQSEQLSWLVLGRSLQNSSNAESDYINQAALVLGLKGGNYLTQNIGQNIGLDSIGFEAGSAEAGSSNDLDQAALVLGKYLSPTLYVSYGLGLLDALSTIKLEYLINDRWSLVTESSSVASGGDIRYSFEE